MLFVAVEMKLLAAGLDVPVHQEISPYTLVAVVPPDKTPRIRPLKSIGPPLSPGAVVPSFVSGVALPILLLPAVPSSKSVFRMLAVPAPAPTAVP